MSNTGCHIAKGKLGSDAASWHILSARRNLAVNSTWHTSGFNCSSCCSHQFASCTAIERKSCAAAIGYIHTFTVARDSGRLLCFGRVIFTARRNARIASAVLAIAIPSVCPSVCHMPVLCQNDGTQHGAVCTVKQQNVSSFVETKKMFPRDDPFLLKSWLQVTYPLLIAASLDKLCLVPPQR